ncbi:hypothetical protein H9L05_02985 [Hymenobacter qilianensis]|uniref:Uncharacterized protein n=1 Tax=Hymenobacter qilianensis TaxID=1385715 RepID=A0A7H0GWR2_9BACT|nr:hypothetical protein [Hymenobacter qilianensis]QNP52728.1 hypothetical protein H9L05_02985 [Hymenobacter qilianensis]
MLSLTISRLPLLVLLALLCACSKPAADNDTADGEEISPYQNLVFQLDAAVAAEDQLNRWDTTQYVRFEPAVRGKFKWTGERELTFSPLEPFRPTTAFTATLQPQYLPPVSKKAPSPRQDAVSYALPATAGGASVLGPKSAGCGHGGSAYDAPLQLLGAAQRSSELTESEPGWAAGGL